VVAMVAVKSPPGRVGFVCWHGRVHGGRVKLLVQFHRNGSSPSAVTAAPRPRARERRRGHEQAGRVAGPSGGSRPRAQEREGSTGAHGPRARQAGSGEKKRRGAARVEIFVFLF
jgi:hypothetical protein